MLLAVFNIFSISSRKNSGCNHIGWLGLLNTPTAPLYKGKTLQRGHIMLEDRILVSRKFVTQQPKWPQTCDTPLSSYRFRQAVSEARYDQWTDHVKP